MADVELSATALSKAYRMVGRDRVVALMRCIQDEYPPDGIELWSKGRKTSEFHLRLLDEHYTIVFVDNDDELTVVTQMHDHPDYHNDQVYEQLGYDEWKDTFAGRLDQRKAMGFDCSTDGEYTQKRAQ